MVTKVYNILGQQINETGYNFLHTKQFHSSTNFAYIFSQFYHIFTNLNIEKSLIS